MKVHITYHSNVHLNVTWEVPRSTRTYIVQQLLNCGLSSARVDILTRYCGFIRGLKNSPSYEVRVMVNIAVRDARSTTGSNARLLEDVSGTDPGLGLDRYSVTDIIPIPIYTDIL